MPKSLWTSTVDYPCFFKFVVGPLVFIIFLCLWATYPVALASEAGIIGIYGILVSSATSVTMLDKVTVVDSKSLQVLTHQSVLDSRSSTSKNQVCVVFFCEIWHRNWGHLNARRHKQDGSFHVHLADQKAMSAKEFLSPSSPERMIQRQFLGPLEPGFAAIIHLEKKHLKKNGRNPKHHQVTCYLFFLGGGVDFFPCNGWCLWWTPWMFRISH